MNYDFFTDYNFAIGVLVIFLLIAILLIIVSIIYFMGMWKLYKKAGKKGWESIVPYYNSWVYVEMAGLNWWWFLLLVANSTIVLNFDNNVIQTSLLIVNIFATFVCNYNISKKLNNGIGLAVFMTVVPIIAIPMIGFSSNFKWDNDVVVSNNGPFDSSDNNNQNNISDNNKDNNDYKYCAYCGQRLNKKAKYCNNCGKKAS